MEEPRNITFKLLCASTVADEEFKYVPLKFDFADNFYRPVFEGIDGNYPL